MQFELAHEDLTEALEDLLNKKGIFKGLPFTYKIKVSRKSESCRVIMNIGVPPIPTNNKVTPSTFDHDVTQLESDLNVSNEPQEDTLEANLGVDIPETQESPVEPVEASEEKSSKTPFKKLFG